MKAAEEGLISSDQIPVLLGDYLAPSLDTTVSAIASALWLLATHPEQWQALRTDRSLITAAFDETIRYETPARGFTRQVTADTELGGVKLPAGSRVLLLLASANRDESYWEEPDTFDIMRAGAAGHVGFGNGIHACAGQSLARMEGTAVLTAMADRAAQVRADGPVWRINNTIRGIDSLPFTAQAA